MKLSFEEKMKIYNDWKLNHKSPERIAKERNLANSIVKYIVKLADRHGIEALEHKWTYYSLEFKEEAMKCLSILGYQIMELSGDGSKNTKKTGILSLKGKKDGMPKMKQKTAQEYEEELEALRQENLRLTIENEY